MLKVVVSSVIILLVCLILFCIKIIIKKNGRFPNTHVGGNPALSKKGIKCAQAQDFEARLTLNLFERLQRES
jgi:hypothetical protein